MFEKHYFFRRSVIYLQLYLVYDVTQLPYAVMVDALQSTKGVIDVAVRLTNSKMAWCAANDPSGSGAIITQVLNIT